MRTSPCRSAVAKTSGAVRALGEGDYRSPLREETMSGPPFRADHVGSFLRPERLRDSARALRRGRARGGRLARDRGRMHPRGRACSGERGPQGNDRRRIPPHLLSHRFPRAPRGRRDALRRIRREVPQGRWHGGWVQAADDARREQGQVGRADPGAGFRLSQIDDHENAESLHPGPVDAAFPRRARGDQRGGLSEPRGFLRRSDGGLSRRDRRSCGARPQLPAIRRHQSRLSVRSRHSRPDQSARRRPGRV